MKLIVLFALLGLSLQAFRPTIDPPSSLLIDSINNDLFFQLDTQEILENAQKVAQAHNFTDAIANFVQMLGDGTGYQLYASNVVYMINKIVSGSKPSQAVMKQFIAESKGILGDEFENVIQDAIVILNDYSLSNDYRESGEYNETYRQEMLQLTINHMDQFVLDALAIALNNKYQNIIQDALLLFNDLQLTNQMNQTHQYQLLKDVLTAIFGDVTKYETIIQDVVQNFNDIAFSGNGPNATHLKQLTQDVSEVLDNTPGSYDAIIKDILNSMTEMFEGQELHNKNAKDFYDNYSYSNYDNYDDSNHTASNQYYQEQYNTASDQYYQEQSKIETRMKTQGLKMTESCFRLIAKILGVEQIPEKVFKVATLDGIQLLQDIFSGRFNMEHLLSFGQDLAMIFQTIKKESTILQDTLIFERELTGNSIFGFDQASIIEDIAFILRDVSDLKNFVDAVPSSVQAFEYLQSRNFTGFVEQFYKALGALTGIEAIARLSEDEDMIMKGVDILNDLTHNKSPIIIDHITELAGAIVDNKEIAGDLAENNGVKLIFLLADVASDAFKNNALNMDKVKVVGDFIGQVTNSATLSSDIVSLFSFNMTSDPSSSYDLDFSGILNLTNTLSTESTGNKTMRDLIQELAKIQLIVLSRQSMDVYDDAIEVLKDLAEDQVNQKKLIGDTLLIFADFMDQNYFQSTSKNSGFRALAGDAVVLTNLFLEGERNLAVYLGEIVKFVEDLGGLFAEVSYRNAPYYPPQNDYYNNSSDYYSNPSGNYYDSSNNYYGDSNNYNNYANQQYEYERAHQEMAKAMTQSHAAMRQAIQTVIDVANGQATQESVLDNVIGVAAPFNRKSLADAALIKSLVKARNIASQLDD